ncbi:MAG: acetyl/propionyl/methylcrotonyl-CoA carboxylase subunit alpha [Gammaproteobacteria bacterium]|nr:acetyl/propionyl/methylcrotonyl-CoA carboxylase subunit alpha [Gammaproteobacteria bacterium]
MQSCMIRTLLIANRGEIACRVIRTARRMGIRTVSVYSDADAGALHVEMADEAVRIGPPPASESYLRIDGILDAVAKTGADAVHPGYGFLSENDDFAEALAAKSIVFIGPPTDAIRAMGSKSAALELMSKAGVPVLPGYRGSAQDNASLRAAAEDIGFPLMVKPVAGGGGKGMRIVADEGKLDAALDSARREAVAAFGDGDLLLERYLESARHVEVQVFADTHGNAVHLFERDCSVQRRHQKVLEEAPAPGLGDAVRARIGEVAVQAAKAIGYVGAGTVEFLFDPQAANDPEVNDDPFYFMEMNTRLQVEHPVTEMVLDLDLVEWQIRVASGQPLPAEFATVRPSGHAIEARVYAEDPARGFLPANGRLLHLRAPGDHAGIRIDSGVREGDEIGVYYDPMIAKLIAHGATRAEAVRRLRRALDAYEILGVTTNIGFLSRIVRHDAYVEAEIDTGFIQQHQDILLAEIPESNSADAALAAALYVALSMGDAATSTENHGISPWQRLRGFRLNADPVEHVGLKSGDRELIFRISCTGDTFLVEHEGTSRTVRAAAEQHGGLRLEIGGRRRRVPAVIAHDRVYLTFEGHPYLFTIMDPDARHLITQSGQGHLTAPMPGKIIAVLVEAGAEVSRGQPLVTMEAMKMEHTITAPFDGAVESVRYSVGDLVSEGADLIHISAKT